VDPRERYLAHLARFGITDPGERLLAFAGLAAGPVCFFAYADAGGLRLKAAAAPSGLLAGGDEPAGDWHAVLAGMPDGSTAAERLAWLRSDQAATAHGIPPPPVRVLHPGGVVPLGVDPAVAALITEPVLTADGGAVTLAAWLLDGRLVAERWRVHAVADAPAVVDREPADTASGTGDRAVALLSAGTADERRWAVTAVHDPNAVPAVAALLDPAVGDEQLRVHATAALARLGGPGALSALGTALAGDPEAAVRRAAAQALARWPAAASGQVLDAAGVDEPDVTVRAEIAQARREQRSR
jgi:hypothetical protein